jgi:hypothetical protein
MCTVLSRFLKTFGIRIPELPITKGIPNSHTSFETQLRRDEEGPAKSKLLPLSAKFFKVKKVDISLMRQTVTVGLH